MVRRLQVTDTPALQVHLPPIPQPPSPPQPTATAGHKPPKRPITPPLMVCLRPTLLSTTLTPMAA